jgi:hypothetical protein
MSDFGFGILNITPNAITSPPEFKEPATLQAMANLKLLPSDLVCPDFSASPLEVTIELERRRLKAIQRIIVERGRIVALRPIERSQPRSKIPRPKGWKLRSSRQRDGGLLLDHGQRSVHIRERVRERMEVAMQEQKAMNLRKEQQREERRRQLLEEERRIQRLRQLKQQEYERQREKRQRAFLRVKRPENSKRIHVLFGEAEPDYAVREPDTEAPPTARPRMKRLPPTG